MPASAQAARIASRAMSYSDRPSERAKGVCPMPTIAARSRMVTPGGSSTRGVGDEPGELVGPEPQPAPEDRLRVGTEAGRRRRRGERRGREADRVPAVPLRPDLAMLDRDDRATRGEMGI